MDIIIIINMKKIKIMFKARSKFMGKVKANFTSTSINLLLSILNTNLMYQMLDWKKTMKNIIINVI